VKAFKTTPLTINEEALATQFQQVKVVMNLSEEEQVALNSMYAAQRAAPNVDQELSGTVSLGAEIDNLEGTMEDLLVMIQKVKAYVDDVNSGKRAGDAEIGRLIADMLVSVPNVDPLAFDKLFNDSLNDLLMISYLSNLTRSQLQIADTLSTWINP
jgi:translation initiation factor 3 subunit F